MKALSLMQPWASLLCAGIKKAETRSYRTNYRGKVYIHASKKLIDPTTEILDLILQHCGPGIVLFPPGGIVGSVEITDCQPAEQWISTAETFGWKEDIEREKIVGDLSPGRYVWICENPVLFEKIIPCNGALSFWNIDAEVEKLINAAKPVQP